MAKIKILRIIARLNIGGPAIHTVLLTEGMGKTRFESLLVCGRISKSEGDMFYYAQERNVKPYFVPELQREISFLKDIIAFGKIYKVIKRENPDIIHTHTAKAGVLGRLAALLYNLLNFLNGKHLKLIHTFHGHIFEGYFDKTRTKLFIFIERFLGRFTDRIITVSESIKKELVSLRVAKEDKIVVIPLGFDLDKFLKIPVKESSVLSIGIIGRLVPIKNHRLFLKAINEVIKRHPQTKIQFKIIGDGELRRELEDYTSRLGISSKVEFLGWQRDLVSVYSELDIVALTSINEGTPVSLIEAMASARAVVATNVGGISDLLGDRINVGEKPEGDFVILERGVMVNFADPVGLADALVFLSQDKPLCIKMGLAGREFARKNFGKDRLLTDIENLYNKVSMPVSV